MRSRLALLLLTGFPLATSLSGCSGAPAPDDKHYSVFFPAYSAALDAQGNVTLSKAAAVARANPTLPVSIQGFSAPPDPGKDVPDLSAMRAGAVQQALVQDGVGTDRISVAANGIMDPKSLPSLSVRRVDVSIGQ